VTLPKRISTQTRNDLFEWLSVQNCHWAGVENEDAFLARLYDLQALPSTDGRPQYPTAAEDIRQHRVRNRDWADDWVFTDPRFNLLHAADDAFLAFLVATVRPLTQRDPALTERLVAGYNELIVPLGWEILEIRRAGDNVYYESRRTTGVHDPSRIAVSAPDIVDGQVLNEQLQRLRRDIDADPAASIAHCKELLESQSKLVLRGLGESYSDRDDLPKLYGAASRALGVHANAVPGDSRASDALRGMLRNLASVVQNISEARNTMGTGHGRADASSAERRHARLVFNATVAVSEFVAETWASLPRPD
jgi:hypothetical protein